MRKRGRIDANQSEIVDDLRAIGATVQILSGMGHGCPDLLVGFQGRNILLEIKDGKRIPSERKLTPDEKDWHAAWRGQVAVVESREQALQAVVTAEQRATET